MSIFREQEDASGCLDAVATELKKRLADLGNDGPAASEGPVAP
jgi:hypothetical protein